MTTEPEREKRMSTTLLSALDVAMLRSDVAFVIPPMTHPHGKYWHQPDRCEIEIDDKHALMSQAAFDKLADYSCSQPTGTYIGKMWKCGRLYAKPTRWFLCWYGEDPDPAYLANHYREIIIV